MRDEEYPVYVAVKRADGGSEQVRVGTAVKSGDGFVLRMGELQLGAPVPAPAASAGGDPGGMVFPNYGRSKGMPIAGATESDLEFYANGCRRTLADDAKARWHEKERVLLAAIEAELAKRRGGGGGGAQSSNPFDDAPPPRDDDIPF